jgi:hypothetical protein
MAKLGDNLSVQQGSPPPRAPLMEGVVAVKRRRRAQPEVQAAPVNTGRTWIVLEENIDIPPTGLYVSGNGHSYMIRAGEEVFVPNLVIEILNNAITMVPVLDQSQKVVGHRKKMRFPYRLITAPARPMAA